MPNRGAAGLLLLSAMTQAANYTSERVSMEGVEVIRLADQAKQTEVLIAPSIGNNAYSMKVKGQQILYLPAAGLGAWKEKPSMGGNPFLAPWCNRIDGDSYWANGKKYTLNGELKNFRRDGNGKPIHGLVVYTSDWQVTAVRADEHGATTTSRLDLWKRPDWMAQFPFAHSIEMTHRLRDGVLEVETVVDNLSTDPLPLSLGYHTYYQLTDAPRDDWKVAIPARKHVVLSNVLTPTGETKPRETAGLFPLKGTQLDDVFTDLERGKDGRSVFYVEGKSQRVAVEYGPNYPVSVIYAPTGRPFICFEPMAGVTNVFNLGHEGKFPLQSVAPGAQWRESFWIRPTGF